MPARLILLLSVLLPLCAQTFTGTIGGRVTDKSGAAIARARVTVTEIATNTVSNTVSNDVGDYVVSFLKPAVYTVAISAPGFKESRSTNLQLQLNQQVRSDAALEVGDVTTKWRFPRPPSNSTTSPLRSATSSARSS